MSLRSTPWFCLPAGLLGGTLAQFRGNAAAAPAFHKLMKSSLNEQHLLSDSFSPYALTNTLIYFIEKKLYFTVLGERTPTQATFQMENVFFRNS